MSGTHAPDLESSFGQIIHQLQDIKDSFKTTFRKDPLFHSKCLCQHTQASVREAHVSTLPLGLLEMRQNEELCDAILEVEGRFIQCHRVVLAAAIPYFKAMFTSSNMAETAKKTISLKDLQYDIVCKIIDFAYGAEVVPHPVPSSVSEVTEKHKVSSEGGRPLIGKDLSEIKPSLEEVNLVMNILHVANMFGMSELEENCCTYLKKFFSLESVLDIFYFCKSHGDAFLSLEAKVTNWIARNFQAVVRQSAFMDIAMTEFLLLVSSKSMYVDDEFTILQAILSWVNHDTSARMTHLQDLLRQTHLNQISDEDMQTAMKHHVMVAASSEVKSYLTNRGVSVDAESASPPTRARAHRVLVFGRKFYLEDTVKDHNLLCIDVETGGVYALPAPPHAFYGTQLGVSCYNHEVMVHGVSRSELHGLVLNRFKRAEGTWDVAPVRHVSNFAGSSKSGYVVDNFCRPPVIASTDGTKPFNFILVSSHEDVDLNQRRERIRANRKPYNAIFYWEITDEHDGGFDEGLSGSSLQYCRIFRDNPASVATGGESDLSKFLRGIGHPGLRVGASMSEPCVVFLNDTLYILDCDYGFYAFTVRFCANQTPCLVDFRIVIDPATCHRSPDTGYPLFPSRQICGVPHDGSLYYVSKTGKKEEVVVEGEDEGADMTLDELYLPPKVVRYSAEKNAFEDMNAPECPDPASVQLFSIKGKLHLFFVQNDPNVRRSTYGWYVLSASKSSPEKASTSSSSSVEWIPQPWKLPALRTYFFHTIESNCVAVTLPSHVLKEGEFLCDKRKNGWSFKTVAPLDDSTQLATTTDDDDADDEDDEDADVYRAFQQHALEDFPDVDFAGGNSSSSSSESEEEEEEEEEEEGNDDGVDDAAEGEEDSADDSD